MDTELIRKLQYLYSVTHIPLSLLNGDGEVVVTFPEVNSDIVNLYAKWIIIADFHAQNRDAAHPLINYMEPGFFLGIMELSANRYLLIGLVSPLPRARNDVLRMIVTVAAPERLQELCSLVLQTPLVPLGRLMDLMCLISELLLEEPVQKENIRLMDIFTQGWNPPQPEMQLFEQRENMQRHESIDFDIAICTAIEHGDSVRLAHSLYAPRRGEIGRMSGDDLRQEKYAFIAMATLAARAAIRGGLPAEISLSLSDLYCQRADSLSEDGKVHELCGRMLTDYCERVHQIQKQPAVSPATRRCLEFISTHLHESISLSQLSKVCGLCTRSLSLNFKSEMGLSINDYIHKEKLKEAEYLLRHTDYPLAQIASYLHYSSQSYFTRIFREFCGITPQQYRDQPK